MVLVTFLVSVICILLVIRWYQRMKKYGNLPPGPKPLPIIGNSHQLKTSNLQVDITELGKKWGDIFTVYFQTKPTVVLNSVAVIREILLSPKYSEVFGGRNLPHYNREIFPNSSIFHPVMEEVTYMRKVFMRGIKMYGTHLKHVEQLAQTELRTLIDNITELDGRPVNPTPFVEQYVANIILILVAGQRFETSHKAFKMSSEMAEDFDYLMNMKNSFLLETVPFARKLFPELDVHCRRMIINRKYFRDTFDSLKQQSKEVMPECLYTYLEDETSMSKEMKQGLLVDAVVAGVATTKPTIMLTLAAMVLFPDMQKRIQEELDEVVGRERLPSLDDKPNLHYTQAGILEIFRYYSISALAGPRTTNEDCTYRGYFIPKGIEVTYNIWGVNHDEEFWSDPFTFNPGRFLDEEGYILPPEDEKRQRLMTFGLGKRSCVGEVLARVRIFLALATILQNFDLKKDPDEPFLSPDPRTNEYTFIAHPPPYKLCFEPRLAPQKSF